MIKSLFLFLTLFLLACSSPKEEPLLLSTNQWIGYSPLFYAQEKGYLDELNIKLSNSVSLGEASNIFLISKAQLVTGTQHEYNLLKNEMNSIIPIILLSRSNGGDMILSNQSLEAIKKSKNITVYLEVDSINKEMIEDFIKTYNLDSKYMHFINKDQAKIQNIKFTNLKDILIVTYIPNNLVLEKRGFKELASTNKPDTLLVIDSICTSKEILEQNKMRLEALKLVIDKSIQEIMNDKVRAHELIKKELGNLSYEEFSNALETIKWINKPSQEFLQKIDSIGYKRENLL